MKVDLFSIGRFTVHTYGVMIAIGVILCVLMGYYRAKRYEMKAESVLDLAILCVVMGFLGPKVFFVILSWKQFLADPLSVLGSSGFVVYGGIVFGVASALIYCKIKDIRFFAYFRNIGCVSDLSENKFSFCRPTFIIFVVWSIWTTI